MKVQAGSIAAEQCRAFTEEKICNTNPQAIKTYLTLLNELVYDILQDHKCITVCYLLRGLNNKICS